MRMFQKLFLLSVVWVLGSCIFSDEKPNSINLQVDQVLLSMTRVEIRQIDIAGNSLTTLFNGPLSSMSQLQKLKASGYDGGIAYFSIRGYRGTDLAYDITVTYNGSVVTNSQKNAVYTYSLINHSGTFVYTTLDALGYTWKDTLYPADTMAVSWYIKPASLTYSAEAEGGLYSWEDTVTTSPGNSDEQKLISATASFILKVTNNTVYTISRVVVNQGFVDSEVVALNIPPSDGSRYNLGMYQAYSNSRVRFEDSRGLLSWTYDLSSYYQTDTTYNYRWVNLFIP